MTPLPPTPRVSRFLTPLRFSLLFLCLAGSLPARAQLYSLETENLQVLYYSKAHEYIVPHLARSFENALQFHKSVFGYEPSEKITVLVMDLGDFGGGAATTLPANRIRVSIAPFSYTYEVRTANERMGWLMNHETTHIVATDKAAPADNVFRTLFGGKVTLTDEEPLSMLYSYLTTPRWYSPRWYHEGLAVFMETWMAGGLGRALGPYDEMVFRSMVRDSSYIYDIVGLESEGTTVDFQIGVNSYLYGTRFMSYIAYQYTPEKLIEWVSRSKDTKKNFGSQFKKVFGLSLNKAWSDWIAWERAWQQENLEIIRSNPTTPFRPLTNRPLGSVSRPFYDATTRTLYVATAYPGEIPHLAAIDIDTGSIKKIHEIQGPALYYVTSIVYDAEASTFYYTADNRNWRDLQSYNLRTGATKTLMKDGRIGDLALNAKDKVLWGVRHLNGISTLVRIPPPYNEWDQVFSFPYGKDIYDLDVSPDGTSITAALVEISGRQTLIKMDIAALLDGDKSYETLFDFENSSPATFVYAPDGNHLYGSSYYSGVSNLYRYDLENSRMEILTNTESGLFRPLPVFTDSLLAFRYSGEGFLPVMLPEQTPERVSATRYLGNEIATKYETVRNWVVDAPTAIDIDSLTTYSGSYRTLGRMGFRSIYPVVQGYKDVATVGLRANFADRLQLSELSLTASVSPDAAVPSDERFHATASFKHWSWRLRAAYNAADFYDLFGPTKTSRKGYALSVGYHKTIRNEGSQRLAYQLEVAGYAGLDRVPAYQNVSASFGELLSANASIDYSDMRQSLGGADDDEKGIKWSLSARSNYVNKVLYPSLHMDLDYGFLLPIDHFSVWLRTSFGYAYGDRDEPFANFFFGGFGNNWVDHQSISRFREYYSFPGVDLNEIGGSNYGKAMMEWMLPPLRFRRVGIPSAYLRWAHLSLFSSGLLTNIDRNRSDVGLGRQRALLNGGGQLDFRLVFFSYLRTTFSLGYGVAFEQDEDPSREFMISLKIM